MHTKLYYIYIKYTCYKNRLFFLLNYTARFEITGVTKKRPNECTI